MRQFSSNILNSFFPGLGCHSHLSWVTWKETNLKMKLLTETERSGCADASPWRVLMFLKIFSSSILSSVEYLLTWSGYKSRWMPLTVFYFIWNIKYVDKQHKKSAYVAHTTKRRPFFKMFWSSLFWHFLYDWVFFHGRFPIASVKLDSGKKIMLKQFKHRNL